MRAAGGVYHASECGRSYGVEPGLSECAGEHFGGGDQEAIARFLQTDVYSRPAEGGKGVGVPVVGDQANFRRVDPGQSAGAEAGAIEQAVYRPGMRRVGWVFG